MLQVAAVGSNGGFSAHSSQLQSCGDSSEEELAVLPPHTKVVVTGNNRTKSVLVGLRGVVKKAVGLGGWHWLVLTNGIEVKLQRNALSVIEAPTGNEDDDPEFEQTLWNSSGMVEIGYIHPRILKSRIDQGNVCKGHLVRPTKPLVGLSRLIHTPKTLFRLVRDHCLVVFRVKKRLELDKFLHQKVDLSKLEKGALWRYLRHFNLVDAIHNPSKEQLIDVVQKHFVSQQMDELQVITGFVQAAKRLKTVCK
ncbi:histone deacetylase complex subunit SAP30 homolog [Striga asiatica]|uniref:Histone deacetylase complex subunit SAP30 homolog n=1 Tax=Striga asiatica TaxID=4170 RepID=A0A5A7QVK0_STRAF|nr:histone deacetylase complex subunit SAP30 homolog [Striga asiatica]